MAFLLLLFLFSCGGEQERAQEHHRWMGDNGKLKVLCSIAMINDIVNRIGGEYVDSIALISGDLDPHSYEIVKGDNEKFYFADLVFYNGLGLEHSPSLLTHLTEHEYSVSLGDSIMSQAPAKVHHMKGVIDPHIWMDISLWQLIIEPIKESLSQLDPDHADSFRANAACLYDEMSDEHQGILRLFESIPESRRYLVTSHDAFNYFTRAYLATDEERSQGLWEKRFEAPEGLAPDAHLSTTDIQRTIDYIQAHDVKILFTESNVNQASLRKIINAANEKGINLSISDIALYGDAMGAPGSTGDTYLKMLRHNASVMVEQFGERP